MKDRHYKTSPVNTHPYRLGCDCATMQKGDPIRVATRREYCSERGCYTDFVYIWKDRPGDGLYALLYADIKVTADVFAFWVETGGIEAEATYQARKDAHGLHIRMGQKYVGDHYAFAADVLGRDIDSLAALSQQERDRVKKELSQDALPA